MVRRDIVPTRRRDSVDLLPLFRSTDVAACSAMFGGWGQPLSSIKRIQIPAGGNSSALSCGVLGALSAMTFEECHPFNSTVGALCDEPSCIPNFPLFSSCFGLLFHRTETMFCDMILNFAAAFMKLASSVFGPTEVFSQFSLVFTIYGC